MTRKTVMPPVQTRETIVMAGINMLEGGRQYQPLCIEPKDVVICQHEDPTILTSALKAAPGLRWYTACTLMRLDALEYVP